MNTLLQTIEQLLTEALLSDIAITFAPPLDVEGNLVNPQQKVLNSYGPKVLTVPL